MIKIFLISMPFLLLGLAAFAQEFKPIELPKPDTGGGKPLMQVLKDRCSTREFSPIP